MTESSLPGTTVEVVGAIRPDRNIWVDRIVRALGRPWPTIIVAFAISLGVGLALVVMAGGEIGQTGQVVLTATVGSVRGLVDSAVYATPRLFVAIGMIVALRAGQFNLGGEGQLQLGAVGAAVGALYLAPGLPAFLGLPVAVLVAMVFGALWAGIAAILKVWRGSDELISTLLLNFIGLFFVQYLVQGPMQDPSSPFNQSSRIAPSTELMRWSGTRLHLGFVLAIVVTVLVWLLISRTALGLRLRSVGFNPVASRYQRIRVGHMVVVAMLISGAIAGLAGASETLGVQFRLIQGFSPGFGFEGLAVAFLAALRPGRALLIALLFGGVFSAATQLQQVIGVTASLAFVVEGLPIVLLACAAGLQAMRAKRAGLG